MARLRRIAKFLMAILILSFSAAIAAQQNSPSPEHPNAVSARNAQITIRGCVTGGKRYTFMQVSTGALFDLNGSTNRFVHVRGKLIEVTANEFSPSQNTSNGLPKLSVNKMRIVANKCPIQAHPEPNLPSSAWKNPQPPPPAPSPATSPYADPGRVSQSPPNVNNPNTAGDTGAPSPGTGNPPPQ